MVLAGGVNKQMVAAIGSRTGAGRRYVRRRWLDVPGAQEESPTASTWDSSAKSARSNGRWIEAIWSDGRRACASPASRSGSDGEYYNINADQMAAACAVACRANALIFLTDVPA